MPIIFVLVLLHGFIFVSMGFICLFFGGGLGSTEFYEVGVCDFYKMIGTRASSIC